MKDMAQVFRKFFILWQIILLTFSLDQVALGEDLGPYKPEYDQKQDVAPPNGTKEKVWGIITLAGGSAIGGGLMVVTLMASATCNDSNEKDGSCANNKDTYNFLFVSGALMLTGGLIGGIYLIRNGKRKRAKWNEWRRQKNAPQASTFGSHGIGFNLDRNAPVFSYNYNF